MLKQTESILSRNLNLFTNDAYSRMICFALRVLSITGLKQDPERADVVHDLLSFLAEQMMSLNNKNQAETTGFLHWLEMTIGAKINSLKNKTKIANYHDDTLATLLDVLKENRKALKVNPSNKEFFDGLKDAFEKSSIILSPLKNRTATTDRLIDLIVYRLYGLTQNEIELVEGGLK